MFNIYDLCIVFSQTSVRRVIFGLKFSISIGKYLCNIGTILWLLYFIILYENARNKIIDIWISARLVSIIENLV